MSNNRLDAIRERRDMLETELGRAISFGGYPAYTPAQEDAMRQERALLTIEIETIESMLFPNRGDLSYEDIEGNTNASRSGNSFKR